jgi:hypothetical protein
MTTSLLREIINVQENIRIESSLDEIDLAITSVSIGIENTIVQGNMSRIVQEIIKEIVLVSTREIGRDLAIVKSGEAEIVMLNNTLGIRDTQLPHHLLLILHIWEITVDN